MLYDIPESGADPKRKEEFSMSRTAFTMRQNHTVFLLLSLLLRTALRCPEMTHERDLSRSLP
jgi:hypothetical protein